MALNNYEKIIIQKLYRYGRPLTIAQIAKYPPDKLSWNTVDKYIHPLKARGYVGSKIQYGKEYWYLLFSP